MRLSILLLLSRPFGSSNTISWSADSFQINHITSVSWHMRDMVMWYWSVAILFWQLSIDHIVNVQYKRCGFARHAWDTPPFLLIVSPTPPVQSVNAYVRIYERTLGQSRDNQTKRGWVWGSGPAIIETRWKKLEFIPIAVIRSLWIAKWHSFIIFKTQSYWPHSVKAYQCR